MKITVNGDPRNVKEGTTVEQLLTELKVPRTALAVERNQSIVPRTQYESTELEDGDKLEIVSLVGGG